jgi:DNA-binding transcriptional ArsR family regulator
MLDAVIPVVALIGLIALSVYLFGLDSTNGALQVGLFTAMSIAGLIAHKNGHSYPALGNAVIGGISSAMGAIFILLAVGALIGTWNMAGTIPTVVDYGIRLLNPNIFFVATAAICAIVGMVTGSSWTTAGTLGVAQPLISQHLRVLKSAGVVHGERHGRGTSRPRPFSHRFHSDYRTAGPYPRPGALWGGALGFDTRQESRPRSKICPQFHQMHGN